MPHLAHLNVARALAPLDSPLLAGFQRGLRPMNRLAERSPGFVWRLADDAGAAAAFGEPEDGLFLLNLSLWESVEALRAYSHTGGHARYLRRRREWFAPLGRPHVALWWMAEGRRPTLAEARQRLDRLRADGPTPEAFTFASPFPPPAAC